MKQNPLKRVLMRACTDEAYRTLLQTEPHKALEQEGLSVPPGVQIVVHENTDDVMTVVLPAPASASDLVEKKELPQGLVPNTPRGIELEWQGQRLLVSGRIDSSTAPALKAELVKCFFDVDVDLEEVEYVSSAGLAALVAGQKHLNQHECQLRLLDPAEETRNLLDLAGLSEIFEIVMTPKTPYPGSIDPMSPGWMPVGF